jgi:hypothetical protein
MRGELSLKSQDILVLLKIASLTHPSRETVGLRTEGWQDWARRYDQLAASTEAPQAERMPLSAADVPPADFTVRALATETGVSKSQVSLSLRQAADAGLLIPAAGAVPSVNRRGLFEFLVYGARYVFPVRMGPLTRGIATGVAAPVFAGKLFSAGESGHVWPDPEGKSSGQSIEPLSPSVPHAVKRDSLLYGMLALTDSLRIGAARERQVAERELARLLSVRREHT